MKKTVALLGDSSIDNAAYVGKAPPVVQQVRAELAREGEWVVVQGAVDGDVIDEVAGQLERCDGELTHVVVSVGGNDALGHRYLLEERAGIVGAALIKIHEKAEAFGERYGAMLDVLLERTRSVVACTIYEPEFTEFLQQRAARAGLVYFNDAILRAAIERGIPVIDLRVVCGERGDLANPIEPSAQGGAKIARAIAQVLTGHDFEAGRSAVYTR